MARFEKNVIWFNVSMKNVVFAEGFKGVDDLFEDSEGFPFGDFSSLSDEILQCAFIAVFVDKIDVVVGFDHFDEVDDVDVVFE